MPKTKPSSANIFPGILPTVSGGHHRSSKHQDTLGINSNSPNATSFTPKHTKMQVKGLGLISLIILAAISAAGAAGAAGRGDPALPHAPAE